MLFAKNLEIVLHLLRQIVEPMLSFHMLFPWKTPETTEAMWSSTTFTTQIVVKKLK